MRFSIAIVALIIPSVFSQLTVTEPFGSTTCTGGQSCQISWKAGPAPPTLAQYGNCEVSIYVGNQQQQTQLQLISASVDVATTSTIQFTVNPAIGPDSDVYFIRFQSPNPDPTTPAIPLLAFSAKFTLAGMNGQFNATVQAQINGATTAAGPPATSTPSLPTTSQAPTTPATTAAKTTSSAKPATTGAASTMSVSSGVFMSTLAAALALFI